jgi:hypothetical protein
MLCQRVINEIDKIRQQIVNLFLFNSAVLVSMILISILAIQLTPFAVIAMPLIIAAYIERAPFVVNPLAHSWYLRKRMRAWQYELERISAPDTRADI